jgi:type I restriction enzyme S subunit
MRQPFVQEFVYRRDECAIVRRTKEQFGGLSNMAGGYPLLVAGVPIRTTEALYQACRYPLLPAVQQAIIARASPMVAKWESRKHRTRSCCGACRRLLDDLPCVDHPNSAAVPRLRSDWDEVNVAIMAWCLRVKLAQHWQRFGGLLLSTGQQPIVELEAANHRTATWGTVAQGDGTVRGPNVLGRILSELREAVRAGTARAGVPVIPPAVPCFLLDGRPIGVLAP